MAVSVDGMRVYIRMRRELLGYTQETFAKAMGMPYPTYRDYEGGTTKDLKAGLFARAVDLLNIPLDHIKALGKKETTVEEAEQLSKEILTPGSYARATTIANQVSDTDIVVAMHLIDSLEESPELLARLRRMLRDADDEGDVSQP